MPILLGIDTGGTYTDAVLYDELSRRIVATAKALTTRHDLAVGIRGGAEAVLKGSGVNPESVALVSLSTTLATNALVEGQGGRVGLVLIGFDNAAASRAGIADALRGDPCVRIGGGHDAAGRQCEALELQALDRAISELGGSVAAFAVAGMFSVRNPEHEIAVRDRLRACTGLPVTCGHELSSRLDGPRRAMTCVLNARLVPTIQRLLDAAERSFDALGVSAPMMVVRGDGALVGAEVARLKPVETILSGPAASLVGASHLTGEHDALVSDIGGTTTDYALLVDGRPRIDSDGASVGGFRTMVEAVAMRTVGLGGDSEVRWGAAGRGAEAGHRLLIGPRRLVPLSLLATEQSRPRDGHPGAAAGRTATRWRHRPVCVANRRRQSGRRRCEPARADAPRSSRGRSGFARPPARIASRDRRPRITGRTRSGRALRGDAVRRRARSRRARRLGCRGGARRNLAVRGAAGQPGGRHRSGCRVHEPRNHRRPRRSLGRSAARRRLRSRRAWQRQPWAVSATGRVELVRELARRLLGPARPPRHRAWCPGTGVLPGGCRAARYPRRGAGARRSRERGRRRGGRDPGSGHRDDCPARRRVVSRVRGDESTGLSPTWTPPPRTRGACSKRRRAKARSMPAPEKWTRLSSTATTSRSWRDARRWWSARSLRWRRAGRVSPPIESQRSVRPCGCPCPSARCRFTGEDMIHTGRLPPRHCAGVVVPGSAGVPPA